MSRNYTDTPDADNNPATQISGATYPATVPAISAAPATEDSATGSNAPTLLGPTVSGETLDNPWTDPQSFSDPASAPTPTTGFFPAKGTYYRVMLSSQKTPPLYSLQGLNEFSYEAQEDQQLQKQREQQDSNMARAYTDSYNSLVDAYPIDVPYQPAVDANGYSWDTARTPEEIGQNHDTAVQRNADARKATLEQLNQNYTQAISELNTERANQDTSVAAKRGSRNQVPVLVRGMRIGQRDITSETPCLGNFKVFYVFGQNFGKVEVSGEILLGPLGTTFSDGVQLLADFFNKFRVSKFKKTVTATMAQQHYQLYVTGLAIGEADPDLHILPFVVAATMIDPANEDTSFINPIIQSNDLVQPVQLSDIGAVNNALNNLTASNSSLQAPGGPLSSGTTLENFLSQQPLYNPVVGPPAPQGFQVGPSTNDQLGNTIAPTQASKPLGPPAPLTRAQQTINQINALPGFGTVPGQPAMGAPDTSENPKMVYEPSDFNPFTNNPLGQAVTDYTADKWKQGTANAGAMNDSWIQGAKDNARWIGKMGNAAAQRIQGYLDQKTDAANAPAPTQ